VEVEKERKKVSVKKCYEKNPSKSTAPRFKNQLISLSKIPLGVVNVPMLSSKADEFIKTKTKMFRVPSALVSVSCAGKQLVLVVRASGLVLGLLDVEQRGRGDLVLGEAALGARRALKDLLSQEGAHDVVEEFVGAAERADVRARGLADDDVDVVDGVAVVLVREEDTGRDDLAAGVPLGREEESKAFAGVGDEARGVGGLV